MEKTDIANERIKKLLSNQTEKATKDQRNIQIATVYDESFAGTGDSRPKVVTGKLLFTAMWYLEQKLRLHQFEMHGVDVKKLKSGVEEVAKMQNNLDRVLATEGETENAVSLRDELNAKMQEIEMSTVVDEQSEIMVSQGFASILARGDYVGSYNGIKGTRFNQLLYGNGRRLILATGNPKQPVKFVTVPNDACYMNIGATHLRLGDKPASEFALVFKVPREQFLSDFAKEVKEAGLKAEDIQGSIPRESASRTRDITQSSRGAKVDDEVEYCYYWKISNTPTAKADWTAEDCGLMYRFVVGTDMHVLKKEDDSEYRWVFQDDDGEDKPYIPVTDRICLKTARGQFGAGIGDVLLDYNGATRTTDNLMAGSVFEDTYPINFVGVPEGNADTFRSLYTDAISQRNRGQSAVVPMAVSREGGQIQVQQIRNNGNLGGATAFKRELELTLKRIGIHLDEMQGYAATATQAELDAQKQTDFIAYISEANAAEALFELRIALDIIKKSSGGDNVPLDIKFDLEEAPLKVMTLGQLREILKAKHWFFDVDPGSSEVPNLTLKRIALRESMQYMQGSPYADQATRELLTVSGVKVKPVDASAQMGLNSSGQPQPPIQ